MFENVSLTISNSLSTAMVNLGESPNTRANGSWLGSALHRETDLRNLIADKLPQCDVCIFALDSF